MIVYKYKLYTTKRSKHIDAMLREASWVWNHALAVQKRYYRMYRKYIDVVQMQKKWAQWYGKSNLLNSHAIQDVLQRLDKSYMQFFNRQQKRLPKFKNQTQFSSIVFKRAVGYTLNGNTLTINKVKCRYKFSLSRPYEGKGTIKRIVIKRTSLGEYFLYIYIDAKPEPIGKSHNGASVGIDFGLKNYLTLSNGERIQSPLYFKRALFLKRKADRELAKKKRCGSGYKAALKKKNCIEELVTNRRDNWQWEIAHDLCRRFDNICIEDLSLDAMKKKTNWGRKMEDLAHGKFLRKLEYLALRYGVRVKKIDRFFPSSKLCDCGHIYKPLLLHDREWTCPACGLHHDRDLHAANNILRQGIASLGCPSKTQKPVKTTVRGRKRPRIPRQ